MPRPTLTPEILLAPGTARGRREGQTLTYYTYSDIAQHYILTRGTFPPEDEKLTKEQEIIRQVQTNTFPHPT